MRKRNLALILIAVLLFFTGYSFGQTVKAAAPLPGSKDDPAVTKSYVDLALGQRQTAMAAQLTGLEEQVRQLQSRVAQLKEQIKPKIILTIGQKVATVGGEKKNLDVAPLIMGGRTMLPFRFVGEALGAEVAWLESQREVSYQLSAKTGTVTLRLAIDKKTGRFNDREIALDVPPVIVQGRTMVPVRVVSELLGARVDWNGATQTVTITPP